MTEGSGSCSGSTLAFTEYVREQGIGVVWAYREDRAQVPSWATAVRAGTARHRWLAARSRWWVTDGLPMRVSGPDTVGRPLERGRDTRVLALVDPTIERVGSDVVDWPLMTPRQQRLAQVRSEALVDVVASPTERVARALGFAAEVLERSPVAEHLGDRAAARTRLGLAEGAEVAAIVSVRGQSDEMVRNLAGLAGLSIVVAPSSLGADGDDAVAAADVLISDTSAWAAVAARRGLAVIVYAPDLRDLLSRGPGLYLPWQRDLPGPWAHDAASLHRAITTLRESHWHVPPKFAAGHAALAELAGSAVDGSCARILEALRGDER